MPSGNVGSVRSLERNSGACNFARAGDSVAVSLQGIDGSLVMAGGVLCHPDFPVAIAKHLELKVLVLDVTTPILIGSQVCFSACALTHTHTHVVLVPPCCLSIETTYNALTGSNSWNFMYTMQRKRQGWSEYYLYLIQRLAR